MVEKAIKNQNSFCLWNDKIDFQKRGDVDYWSPRYAFLDELNNFPSLTEFITDICYGTSDKLQYYENGVPFLRVTDIDKADEILWSNEKYIPENVARKYKKERVEDGDILLSRTGTLGIAVPITERFNGAVFGSYFIKINFFGVNQLYLSTFINSKYGRQQFEKASSGAVQTNITIDDIKNLKVFVPPLGDQQKVGQIVQEAFQFKKEAEDSYKKSQQLLNEAMGLANVEQGYELTFWRWSDEIDAITRIDPDYYRTGYIQLAKAKSIKVEPLSDFVISYSGGYTFETEKYLQSGIPIIRIKDLNYPEVEEPEDAFFADLPELQRFTAKPDDILISMSGTVGLSAIIPNELPKCYVNQRITAITTKGINRFYLLAFLNSRFYREELEKIGTGGVQTNVSYKQIVSLPVPRLGDKEEIIGNFLVAFIEKDKASKRKLQEAKDFVEDLVKKQKSMIRNSE